MIKKIYYKLRRIFHKSSKHPQDFINELDLYRRLDVNKRFELNDSDLHPCLADKTEVTNFDGHYIYHPAWAIRILKEINPVKHIDISSTLHFCSMVSAFIPTDFYDYRPALLNLNGLHCGKADLMNLPFESGSIESISCMHTIEHVGLGRYGDAIDPNGDIKAINELIRVTKKNGTILFVVPVGKPKIAFNAHRIYDPNIVIDLFVNCQLKNFALVTDNNRFIANADLSEGLLQKYGCGCFWFVKTQ